MPPCLRTRTAPPVSHNVREALFSPAPPQLASFANTVVWVLCVPTRQGYSPALPPPEHTQLPGTHTARHMEENWLPVRKPCPFPQWL